MRVDKDTMEIRKIKPEDNVKIARAIREVLIEYGVPKVGTAYEDESLDCMFETYDSEGKAYFLVDKQNEIYGGAGISPLENYNEDVCELQKMYFKSEIRGIGLGTKMMDTCLEFAKSAGFKKCYLETMPYMDDARKLYRKFGFETLPTSLGNTGHYSCTVWMIKDL